MSEQRDIWAARKQAAEEAQKTAETRELKTPALAHKNAREVASYFYSSTDIAGKLNLCVRKNAELADCIWEEAVPAVKEAKEETAELLVQNLRTIEADMPSDLG